MAFTLKSMFDRPRKQKSVKKSMFWVQTRAFQLGLMACLIGLTACGGSTNQMGPRTPSGFKVTPGNAQVVLSWTANRESDMAAYVVFYGPASGALSNTSVINAPATTTTITGLTNGTPYLFAIAARNTAGATSGRTAGILGTPVAPPPPPAPPPPAPPITTHAVNHVSHRDLEAEKHRMAHGFSNQSPTTSHRDRQALQPANHEASTVLDGVFRQLEVWESAQ